MSAGVALDHLVVGAASLEQGCAALRNLLGVTIPFGGAHPLMGTHNCLTRIGPGLFLEIIAIDPGTPAPDRPRWFGLDDPGQQTRLRERPRLIAWVAGVPSLAALAAAALPFGRVQRMTRGRLAWSITIPDQVPEGVLPALIEWPDGPHPSEGIAYLGLRFERLRLVHPDPARIVGALHAIGAANLVDVAFAGAPGMEADIRRADGRVVTLD